MSELFTGPHTGRNAPDTSRAAAEKIEPALPTIRAQVLAFAHARGAADADSGGFIDEELAILQRNEEDKWDRSIRPRRSELTDENWIVHSGFKRPNAQGNECVVWVHRDHHPCPPPIVAKPERVRVSELRKEADAMVLKLGRYAEQMRREGRGLFAAELTEAARIMKGLAE